MTVSAAGLKIGHSEQGEIRLANPTKQESKQAPTSSYLETIIRSLLFSAKLLPPKVSSEIGGGSL